MGPNRKSRVKPVCQTPAVSVEALVKRDRVVAAGLAGVTQLAWAWLVRMGGMDMGVALPAFSPLLAVLMWAVMWWA